MMRLVAIAIALACGCAVETDTMISQPVEERPIAPAALPQCSGRDGSSCSSAGHTFACDNGRWHPPGRVGRSGLCICTGATNICG